MQPKLIVGIGASAGGLDALQRFFENMPLGKGFSFVVIQHLSPDFKSVMDEILSRYTKMQIFNVEEGMKVETDSIYLIPPRKEMIIQDGVLHLSERNTTDAVPLPIDVFFRSLAKDQGEKAVSVVLSGTGSDGSRGIVDVHEAGGVVLAQNEDTASFVGMPRVAAATGVVNYVVSPDEMPEILMFRSTFLENGKMEDVATAYNTAHLGDFAPIFRRLREEYGIDFSSYKQTTISRRIQRRVEILQLHSIKDYAEHAVGDLGELEALYRDLLIGVTQFFRDPEAFAVMENKVIPQIIQQAKQGEVRVWVPACASGEEAYSLAISIKEKLREENVHANLKIFATDAHSGSIALASRGLYQKETLENVSAERLDRYFIKEDEGYRICEEIRNTIVFAQHNLLSDPPFNNVHLISCRNLLIYFNPIAQHKALSLFHYALYLNGVLFLGPSEALGKLEQYFQVIDKTWKIHQKTKEGAVGTSLHVTNSTRKKPSYTQMGVADANSHSSEKKLLQIYSALMEQHLESGLLINEKREIIHTFGDAGRFLRPLRGEINLDALSMVEGDLKIALSASIIKAGERKEPVTQKNIAVEMDGSIKKVNFSVYPLEEHSIPRGYLFITFENVADIDEKSLQEIKEKHDHETFDAQSELIRRISELEEELKFTKENLQCMVEEVESSNEELQSSNEELLASNEELQSTNEELHSVNEELYTVNAEYEKKNAELVQLNHDIDNLLRSTDIGTVFVDKKLCIRKFTPAIGISFKLITQDIGRPIDHFSYHVLGHDGLMTDLRQVIESGETIEKEVRHPKEGWMLLRILPFRGSKNEIEGAVLTFVDISKVKQTEEMLMLRNKCVQSSPDGIVIADAKKPDWPLISVNQSFLEMTGYTQEEVLSKNCRILQGPGTSETTRTEIKKALKAGTEFSGKILNFKKNGQPYWNNLKITPIMDPANQEITHYLGISRDITQEHETKEKIEEQTHQLTLVNKDLESFAYSVSHDLQEPLRTVDSFLNLLADKYKDGLDEKANEFIGYSVDGANRMSRMIDHLLEYTRIHSRGKPFRIHDSKKILENAMDALAPLIQETQASIKIPKMPSIHGDAEQLQKVFYHLLKNALTHCKKTPLEITIQSEKQGDFILFSVQDNGEGLPTKDSERLFRILGNIGHKKEMGQTARGLPMAKRIVLRHRGDLWVESSDESGTVFKFSIPARTLGEHLFEKS